MRCILLLALACAAPLGAAETPPPQPPSDFVRFTENAEGAALQTAIAGYVSPDGVTVDLVGAVHIADKAYFEALNERFKGYDAVLYELVGRPVAEREELTTGDGDHKLRWLGQLQEGMRKSLALESQLHIIDYTAPNFVHADMSIEGFFESQQEKKESFLSLWWKAVKAQNFAETAAKPSPGLGKVLELLCRKDSATELKRLIGSQFDAVENIVAGIEEGGGTTIISERNRHALTVLDRQIANGRRHLAIFYGAAHLADMEARLLKQGWQLQKIEFLDAWSLPPPPAQPAAHAPAKAPAPEVR
jgi:hypothetical protein